MDRAIWRYLVLRYYLVRQHLANERGLPRDHSTMQGRDVTTV